jgi:hypothetical protein
LHRQEARLFEGLRHAVTPISTRQAEGTLCDRSCLARKVRHMRPNVSQRCGTTTEREPRPSSGSS